MLLTPNKPTLRFGPGELHRVTLEAGNGVKFALCHMREQEWLRLDHEVRGRPVYFMLDLGNRLSFWPKPDVDYEVKVIWSEMHED